MRRHPQGTASDLLPHPLERRHVRGEFICTPGGRADKVFVLQEGRARVFIAGEGKELTLAFLEPGEIFSTHSRAWVEAFTDCRVQVADTAGFQARLLAEPQLTPVIIRVFARLLAGSIGIIENLAFRDVPARLANFLLERARETDPALPPGLRVALVLRTEDIARLLGTTRQSVSSLITQLERDGVVARDGRRTLILLDPAELRRRAGAGGLSAG
ncbi:Crp/Fnr family transcriptional regulator [Pseudothauera nasutitermitis]|uniref:Crp/Fnr family transcriptional regulator n=1 Tax=Pseudothauera nasutitermitis TaxID=2565930 RepID=A0A4S4B256_9RHOO|nr:Crp/Fnr family transcriptional regulator [Pseudothauera nasutitermitis]THF66626.1 Crp/Fnr family transcriptional regulator [Pseudothauera nasutitermitis]